MLLNALISYVQNCLLEIYNLGYDPNTLKILYEMNRETDIIIRTPVGSTDNIQVSKVLKQGSIFHLNNVMILIP